MGIRLFEQSYSFEIPNKLKDKELESIFPNWKGGRFEGEFKVIDRKSKNNILYRYLVGKGGFIYVELFKNEDILKAKIKEMPIGFFLPVVFLVIGFVLIFFKTIALAKILFMASLFFFIFIFFVFKISTKKIKGKIENRIYHVDPLQRKR